MRVTVCGHHHPARSCRAHQRRRLSSRRRAQIQHALARLYVQQQRHGLRSFILNRNRAAAERFGARRAAAAHRKGRLQNFPGLNPQSRLLQRSRKFPRAAPPRATRNSAAAPDCSLPTTRSSAPLPIARATSRPSKSGANAKCRSRSAIGTSSADELRSRHSRFIRRAAQHGVHQRRRRTFPRALHQFHRLIHCRARRHRSRNRN